MSGDLTHILSWCLVVRHCIFDACSCEGFHAEWRHHVARFDLLVLHRRYIGPHLHCPRANLFELCTLLLRDMFATAWFCYIFVLEAEFFSEESILRMRRKGFVMNKRTFGWKILAYSRIECESVEDPIYEADVIPFKFQLAGPGTSLLIIFFITR